SSMARKVGAPGRPSLARSAASQLWGCSAAGSAAPERGPSPPSLMGLMLLTLMAHSRGCARTFPETISGRRGAVGVGSPDGCQDRRLQAFHRLGGGAGFMVVAKQMEQPVHDEVLEMVRGLDGPFIGFAQHRLGGKDDVPQMGIRRGR